MDPSRTDADPSHAPFLRARPARYRGFTRSSRYLSMRDGVRIAVDVCLPRGLEPSARVPAIVRQTRYFRRFRVHPLLARALGSATLDPMNAPMRELFTARGYAWIDVDARGSGASFGERPCPWWLDGEVADGAEIVDWIVRQPWSSGLVGSTGVSYDGTTAEFLAITGHPAVRAIAPRFCLFDVFTDVGFPGGLHNAYFTEAWERANAALDRDEPGEMIALIFALQAEGAADPRAATPGTLQNLAARALGDARVQLALKGALDRGLGGVAPVDYDASRAVLAEALRSHAANYSTHGGALHTTFRDDSPPDAALPGQSSDAFSPHRYVDRIGDVAVLSYAGWFDGAYASGAVKRLQALGSKPGAALLAGPWVHGGLLDMDPFHAEHTARFDHAAELLRFFDAYLLPGGGPASAAPPPPVRYFSMGDRAWRAADAFPPAGVVPLVLALGAAGALRPAGAPVEPGEDRFEVDPEARAGRRTRWRTLLCPFLHADGVGRSGRAWTAESPPLERPLVLAGSPRLALDLASSEPDCAVLAYLEAVGPNGEASLLSEGAHRTLHRTGPDGSATYARRDVLALAPWARHLHTLELLPLAITIPRGHRLRLTLTGADRDHFTSPGGAGPASWRIARGSTRLTLPALPPLPFG